MTTSEVESSAPELDLDLDVAPERANGIGILRFLEAQSKEVTRCALAIYEGGRPSVVTRGIAGEENEAMATRFWKRADARADQLDDDAVLRFAVVTYDKVREVVDTYTFNIGSNAGDVLPPVASSPPAATSTGVMRQTIRHLDKREVSSMKFMDLSAKHARQTMAQMQRQIDGLIAENNGYRKESREAEKNRQRLKSKVHERAIAQGVYEENSAFKMLLLESGLNLGKIGAHYLLTGGRSDVDKFLESFSAEQIAGVHGICNGEQRKALLLLMQSAADAKVARGDVKDDVRLVAAPEPDPQPEAAGP